VAALFSWECGPHLYSPQNLKYIFTQPNLNICQRIWLELIKDYNLEVHYHLGMENVVADALSRKTHCNYLPVVHLTSEELKVHLDPHVDFGGLMTDNY
jgi:hypothetical protein